ncbi:FeoA family protein [Thioclava sp.]|uniref:FeoA family protein n=1 Tax=Thioclava sp. TaxID=1933450 RepID=UPI00324288C8
MKASPIENQTCKCALPLGQCRRGFRGTLVSVCPLAGNDGYDADELELRLLELGFIEGASVHILHEGPFGRDPIAVRVNDTTVALRRAEAMAILAE